MIECLQCKRLHFAQSHGPPAIELAHGKSTVRTSNNTSYKSHSSGKQASQKKRVAFQHSQHSGAKGTNISWSPWKDFEQSESGWMLFILRFLCRACKCFYFLRGNSSSRYFWLLIFLIFRNFPIPFSFSFS